VSKAFQYRTGSSFRVEYPDFPSFMSKPHHIRIHQEIGAQDVVEMYYTQFNARFLKSFKTGVPVHIVWQNDKVSHEFFGYVLDATPTHQQSLDRHVLVRCVSASFSLKEGGEKIWKNKTLSEIVTDFAKKFKLKPVITPNVLRFTQQSLAGHTHWEKLQEMASRVGWAAHVHGTELHFHPIDEMINKSMTVIPILSFNDPFTNPWGAVMSQTLDVFSPTVGDYMDRESNNRKHKTISGVDPVTGKLYSTTNSADKVGKGLRKTVKAPLLSEILPQAITESLNMAKEIAKGAAHLSRFSIHAEGTAQGDPRIAPWKTVEISGTGDTTDGFWVVKQATHHIFVDGRYEVDFKAMIDGTDANKPNNVRPSEAGMAPIRNIQQELTTGTTSKPTSTTLSSTTLMVSETNTGYIVNPRKWVGR